MYPVSSTIEQWLRKRDREFIAKAEVNGIDYFDDVLIDFTVENSLSLSDELELGTVIPNKLTIRFRTRQEFLSNAKIVPYLALSSDGLTWQSADIAWQDADFAWEGGHTDWMPLGEFYIDNRTVDRGIWTYTCYDKLVFADVPYISQLHYPTTMQAVWDEICTRIGFTYDSSVQIDPTYTIGAGPAGYSCRQVMGFIASAHSACAYMDKGGTLKFRKLAESDAPVFEMDEADYIRAKQVNPLKSYSRVVVVYDVDDGLFYEAGTGDDNQTLYIDNPFGTQVMADDILTGINGFSYTPISMPARGFPQLDQGDIIGFRQVESMAWQDADVTWEDANFAWDGRVGYQSIILHQVLDFKGGLSMQIEAPSVSEQKSEFVVEGTLEQQVNRVNRNALKFDKPYHGVTHSREHGIVTQRTDGSRKLTINSDVLLDWEVNGQRKLYYDEDDDAIKFSGIIEASEFKGGSIQIGTAFSVNNAGHMKAVGAEFSGTIEASVITGGQINGAFVSGGVITGALIQTAGSYPRIEMSSSGNLLGAYTGVNNYIRIHPLGLGVPEIEFVNSTSSGTISMLPGSFHIDSQTSTYIGGVKVNIEGSNGVQFYTGGGYVDVPNWGKLRNFSSGRTLQQDLDALWIAIANL